MAIKDIVTMGFGSFSRVNRIPTLGYGNFSIVTGPYHFEAVAVFSAGAKRTHSFSAGAKSDHAFQAGARRAGAKST